MNYLFTNAPMFVPGMKNVEYQSHDLEKRTQEEVDRKNSQVEYVEEQ